MNRYQEINKLVAEAQGKLQAAKQIAVQEPKLSEQRLNSEYIQLSNANVQIYKTIDAFLSGLDVISNLYPEGWNK